MRLRLRSWFVLLLTGVLPVQASAQQQERPDPSRFVRVTVIDHGELDEPMVFEVLPDGTVYIAERKGAIKMYDPVRDTVVVVDTIRVNLTYVNAAGVPRDAEEGLVGFTLDPNFEQNHWAYVLYAHPTIAKHVLSRVELHGATLNRDSEVVLLEYDVQRETCCHTGGGMAWDADGNLYITTGNNTGNSIGVQTDQRPGRMNWDDQRGSANTNDLRGKILRIHPEPDGMYTIPPGNLFPPGTPGTRPEIFAMGLRNPWRVSIDSRTGYVYWGEVGPDAAAATDRTVEGYDEFNQARGPGFFGWPYFIGPNRAYPMIDYVTNEVHPPQDPARPINDSRWNNGLRELPPAQPAFIYYPYDVSEEFPELGTGGRCAVGGPIFRSADFVNAPRPWPDYFDGKWFITDCVRNWIMVVTLDENSEYVSMERFMPDYDPIEPLDMKFAPSGDLYVLEYGSVWFAKSPDSRLTRIEYISGNRAPIAAAEVDVRGGPVPLRARLSAESSSDPDGDALTYQWRVVPRDGGAAREFSGAVVTVDFDRAGEYTAVLTVRDAAGAEAVDSVRVVAGNAPPNVAVRVTGNQSFFFPDRPVDYAIEVTDREDGTIATNRLVVHLDYVPEGVDLSRLALGGAAGEAAQRLSVAEAIMAGTDCRACHQPETRVVGPSFREISNRYAGDEAEFDRLVRTVREGGSGRWGDLPMPAHPALTEAEAAALVRYILEVGAPPEPLPPLAGPFRPEIPQGDNGRGSVVIRAAYTDGGASGLPAQTSDAMLVLRSTIIQAGAADVTSNVGTRYSRETMTTAIVPYHDGYIGFVGLDMTGIRRLAFDAQVTTREGHVGGTIEVRLDSPTGELAGAVEIYPPVPGGRGGGPGAAAAPGGRAGGPGGPPPRPSVMLPPLTGPRDVYLVFRNPQARPVDPLLVLSNVRFETE